MANITGRWALAFSGEINQECITTSLISLDDKILTVWQTEPSGQFFQDQIASESTGMFAQIPNVICGGGYLVELIEDDADIPYLIDAYKTNKLIIPSYPLEIEITGLKDDYEVGNGTYEITSFFQNESPTYKSTSGWFIVKMDDGHWYIVPNINGLGQLKGGTGDPAEGFYVLTPCDSNCPTAFPSNPRNPRTPTPVPPTPTPTPPPAPTPTPPNVNAITLVTDKAEDTKIKLKWSTDANVKSWTIQMTTLLWPTLGEDTPKLDWNESTELNFNAETTTNTFQNLTHSKVYYFRIRMQNQNNENSDWLTISTNTTIPASSVSATIFLNSAKQPHIRWNAPTLRDPRIAPFLEFDYEIHIEKFTPNTNVVEKLEILKPTGRSDENYVDTNSLVEGVYRYRMLFKSGIFFGDPLELEINIDRTNPNPPILSPQPEYTNVRIIPFSWNEDSDVKRYEYKFNNSAWTGTDRTALGLTASPGKNTFKIIAEDHSGNRSEESVQIVNLDITKPNPPIINSIEPLTTSSNQTFSWSSDETDLKSFVYRLYRGVAQNSNAVMPWTSIDKSITQVKLELSQGINTFSIKSVDHVGNESDVVSTVVKLDSVKPPKPILSRVDPDNIASSSDKLRWIWRVEDPNETDVAKWKYRFTTWKEEESPANLNWITVEKNTASKETDAAEGYNRFEVRSVDEAGNESDITSSVVLIDSEPPVMPTLFEPVTRILNNKSVVVKFSWEVSTDTFSVVYRLNQGQWKEQSISSDPSIELPAIQDINTFEIYAKDSRGNKSNTNSIQVRVDSIPPSKPVITGPHGECPNELWKDIWIACQNSKLDIGTDLRITYSFMPKNTLLGSHFEPDNARESAVYAGELFLPNVNIFENIKNAFADWSSNIKKAFPNVNIEFVNIGIETGEIPSSADIAYTQSEQGDIRIAFSSNDTILYQTNRGDRFVDNNTKLKTGASDIIIDSKYNWADHSLNISNDFYDLRMNARYYIAKCLGLGVSPSTDIGMHKLRKGNVNGITANSGDTEIFLKTYSLPSESVAPSTSFKVIKSSDLNMTFESAERVSFEWKYIFISNDSSSEILTTSTWNSYETQNTRNGNVNIVIDQSNQPSDTIRFYVRSKDEFGNISDETYVDVRIISESPDIDIESVVTRCETDTRYKHGDNCWDKYGLFGCELIPSRDVDSQNTESLRSMASSISTNYSVVSFNLNLNSLLSSSQYKMKVFSQAGTKLYRIGDAIPNSHIVPYNYSFSLYKQSNEFNYATDDSDIVPPDSVEITKLEHHRDVDSDGFTKPLGETRTNSTSKPYTPAMKLSWNSDIPSDFEKYEIFVSNYSTFEFEEKPGVAYTWPPKTVVKEVYDVNQQSLKIELDDYSKKHYFKIVIHDTSGNTSESDVRTYTTVDENPPPTIQENMKFFLYGRTGVYNERPEDKYKLQFHLPVVADKNYPIFHNIPDTEYPTRTDYSDSDWFSLLGHLPYRIDCVDWPSQKSGSDFSSFYMSRNSVLDRDLNSSDTIPFVDPEDGLLKFNMKHFEQDKQYKFVFYVYDITGHYTAQTYTINTPPADVNVDNPPDPEFDTQFSLYWNGKDSFGNDISDTQWVVEFSWKLKETNDLTGFILSWKVEDEDNWNNGFVDKDNDGVSSVVNAGIVTYTVRFKGFASDKTYQFKTSSVNSTDHLSNEVTHEFTCPVGDKNPPERAVMTTQTRRIIAPDGTKHYGAFVYEPPREGNLDLYVFVTRDVNNLNFYTWETRYKISSDQQKYREWEFVELAVDKVPYKFAFLYADASYNWSIPVFHDVPSVGEIINSAESELMDQSSLNDVFTNMNNILKPLDKN